MISQSNIPGRRRALIVESHPAILRILQESLRNAGYDARITISAPHALRYARRFRPDALVLGVAGPIGPVRNLLATLREGAGLEDTPCVLLCHGTEASCADLEQSISDSRTSILRSPFSPRRLLAELAEPGITADAS